MQWAFMQLVKMINIIATEKMFISCFAKESNGHKYATLLLH